MDDIAARVARLAAELVAIDSRSSLSNLPVADRIEAALIPAGFEIERLDYRDAAGVAKRALVAHRGPPGGHALSGHMDTVPDTGWTEDPWSGRIDRDGVLHGLGAADMKGPVAACILAAIEAAPDTPATLLLTTDEETTKEGARAIATRSVLARGLGLRGIVVAEPTHLVPVRGHRASTDLIAIARGVQAHSSTGKGWNANWALIPYLATVKAIAERLRADPALQDPAYDPPFCDFNLTIDNHGTAVNVNVPVATARVKFRYSRRIDPAPVIAEARAVAEANGLEFRTQAEGPPPELPEDHPLIRLALALTGANAPRTAPYGTDAAELQEIAPCVVLGPGSIEVAHKPGESVPVAALAAAVPLFGRILAAGRT